jgi:hypothetical protein
MEFHVLDGAASELRLGGSADDGNIKWQCLLQRSSFEMRCAAMNSPLKLLA